MTGHQVARRGRAGGLAYSAPLLQAIRRAAPLPAAKGLAAFGGLGRLPPPKRRKPRVERLRQGGECSATPVFQGSAYGRHSRGLPDLPTRPDAQTRRAIAEGAAGSLGGRSSAGPDIRNGRRNKACETRRPLRLDLGVPGRNLGPGSPGAALKRRGPSTGRCPRRGGQPVLGPLVAPSRTTIAPRSGPKALRGGRRALGSSSRFPKGGPRNFSVVWPDHGGKPDVVRPLPVSGDGFRTCGPTGPGAWTRSTDGGPPA